MKKVINPIGVARPAKSPSGKLLYSQAAIAEGKRILYTAGQLGIDKNWKLVGPDLESQTRQALKNLQRIIEAAGGSLEDIVKLNIYVVDVRHLKIIHKVRSEFFKGDYPAATLVQVSKLAFNGLIEIEAVAILD